MCIVSFTQVFINFSDILSIANFHSTSRYFGLRVLIGRDNKRGSKCNAILHGCGSRKLFANKINNSVNLNQNFKNFAQPQPRITWRRNDGSSIVLHNQTGGVRVDTVSGSILNLYRVDRRQMGAYLCIAGKFK